jgi:hypothetical protein
MQQERKARVEWKHGHGRQSIGDVLAAAVGSLTLPRCSRHFRQEDVPPSQNSGPGPRQTLRCSAHAPNVTGAGRALCK